MRSDSPIETSRPRQRVARFAWPALAIALAVGVVEWVALVRSRGADRMAGAWRSLTHR